MVIRRISFLLMAISYISYFSCQKETISTLKEPVSGMEFVHIQKGSFQVGKYKTNNDSISELIHRVYISRDFWLGRTEVTQDQWQKIMGSEEMHPKKPSPFRGVNPNYPVVSVSYFDIEKFLERLNELSNEYHFRLPTEAEWEYACRAGTTTPFSYGLSINDSLANFNAEVPSIYSAKGNYLGHPVPIGSYAPNQWGLYDMHGNVWEWVSDWYAPFSEEEVTNPKGPTFGKEKIIRGGSWYFGAENAMSSCRRKHEPQLWGFSIGFRIVCEEKY